MNDDTILPIIFTVALSLGIALFAYFLLVHFTIDGILQTGHVDSNLARENNLLNFYGQYHDGDIYVLGSSYVNEGIDGYVIEDLLQKKTIIRSVYILGLAGDNPLLRICEIDDIIASRPKMVVYALSYRDLVNDTDIFQDRILLCFQKKQILEREQITKEIQPYYNEKQLKFISQSSFERFFYQRKFLSPFLSSIAERFAQDLLIHGNKSSKTNNLREYPDLWVKNFKDPWVYTTNETETEKNQTMGNRKIDLVSEDLNPQKEALQYIITRLQQNNISVIIINMPLDPHYSSAINESSRHNLSNFLNSTGVPWYDYEREYPTDYFMNAGHMNIAGRTDFSPKVATLIAENLKNGV